MKQVKLLLLFSLSPLLLNAQTNYIDYFKIIELADHKKRNKEPEAAIELYQKAFELAQGRGPEYLSLANCYLALEDYDQAKTYIYKAIELGVPNRYLKRLRKEKEGEEAINMWEAIHADYQKMRDAFYAKIDLDNYIELKVIKNADQVIRRHLMSKAGYFEDSTLVAYGRTIDSLNLERLIKIIEKDNRWPGFQSYGDAESGAYYVLLHFTKRNFSDSTVYKKYYAYLQEVSKEGLRLGELTPFQYAYWIDYELKSREGMQLYGVPSYQKWEKYPFKDQEVVDKRRQEIGLPSLETLYKRESKELPDWYQSIIETKK